MTNGASSNASTMWFKLQADVAGVVPALRTVEAAIDTLGNAANTASKKTESFLDKISSAYASKFKGIFNAIPDGDINKIATGAAKLQSGVDTAMKGIVVGATAATTAMGGLATAALRVGGSFEAQMMRVKSVAGGTDADFEALKNKAMELGEALPVSASQVAEAMYSIASAGLDTKQTIQAVGDIVNLATAHNYELGASSDLVVSTMKSFGLEASQTGRIVDVFTSSVNASQLNMDKLSFAMRYVAPVASSLGLSLEQTTAALAALSDSGMRGEALGTGLRSVMLSLVKPSKEAAEALDRLGVTAYDNATGKLKPLVDIFAQLKAANMSMKDAATIFGTEGSTSASYLVTVIDVMKRYEDVLAEIGSTEKQVAEMASALSFKIARLKSVMEAGLLVLFDQIKIKSKGVVDTLAEQVSGFNQWALKTGAVAKVITSFLGGLGFDIQKIANIGDYLNKINVDAVAERFKSFGEGINSVISGFKSLNDVVPWGGIANHFEFIIKAVAASWLMGKAAVLISNVTSIAGAFGVLYKALSPVWDLLGSSSAIAAGRPVVAGLMAIAAGVASITANIIKKNEAERQQADYTAEADRLEQAAIDYTDALNGNMEALDRLPEKYKKMAEATLDARKAAKALAEENKILAAVPISETYEKMRKAAKAAYDAGESTADVVKASTDAISKGMARFIGEDKIKKLVTGWGKDFRDGGNKAGKAMGEGIIDGLKSADLSRKLNIVTDAIKAGLLKGQALKEAGGLIGTFVNKISVASGKDTASEFEGFNLSAALLSKLQASQASRVLESSGVKRAADNKISVQINTVNVKNTEEAKKAGENIGAGIRASFSPGY